MPRAPRRSVAFASAPNLHGGLPSSSSSAPSPPPPYPQTAQSPHPSSHIPRQVQNRSHQHSRSQTYSQTRSQSHDQRGSESDNYSLPDIDDEGEDNDEDEDSEGVIMAVDYKSRKIGCAFYSMVDQKLSLMEDIELPTSEYLEALKFQIKPTVLLIASRFNETLETTLNPEYKDEYATPYHISIRPTGEFSYEAARNKLISIKIGQADGPILTLQTPGDIHDIATDQKRRGNLLRLAGWVSVDSRISVGCSGAVLTYLQRKLAAASLTDKVVSVANLEMWSMNDTMFVNADTMCALQIFEDESHPNFLMQGPHGRGKEGLSLFGIMNLTRSPLGHTMLKQWFLRPSLSIEVINERHDSISAFLRPDVSHMIQVIGKSLRKIKNIPKILAGLRKGLGREGRSGEWSALQQFCFYALKIKTCLQEMNGIGELPIIKKVAENFNIPSLQEVGQMITETIDFEESVALHRVVLQRNIDEELDEMKRLYDGLGDMLGTVARDIARDMPLDVATSLNVIFFPQIGYLIVIPAQRGNTTYGLPNDTSGGPAYTQEGWDLQFCTETNWYYKNPQMRDLDGYFGDLYGCVCDREIELVHAMKCRVLQHDGALTSCAMVCAELDCLLAMAEAAERYKFTRPVIVTDNVINIKGGRHPLQELCVSAYIENDTLIIGGEGILGEMVVEAPDNGGPRSAERSRADISNGDGENAPSMMLLTGPNYSGKSVYLKQVALIVYMAHIGSFVPAKGAVIGLTDKILTRIQTRESVSKIQSAFMIDLQQISSSLRLATRRSLLIIDEFGKGTDSSDGAGLACSVFENLLSRGKDRPKVISATHYHEIVENGMLIDHTHLQFAQMKILLDHKAVEPEDQITYLYKLEMGRSTSSFGTVCAALNGIHPAIVSRAEDLILMMARGEDLVAACEILSAGERKELEEAVISHTNPSTSPL
ncbi:muts domain V-domain-containing protein [Tuber brumale]|nr:muts domain V-domain-containing protein [Tuber brumale]